MSITWREAMEVGDASVDADHKHLVDLINDFEVAIKGKINHKQIAKVLLELVDYTGEHFKREEELQLKVRYPYYDSHRRSHRDVLKHLTEYMGVYVATPLGPQRDAMIRDLAGFLREWLVDHIIQSDLRMKPFVQHMQAEQAESDRRRRDAVAASQKTVTVFRT